MVGTDLKDRLKSLIFADYLKSIEQVRAGADPEKSFRDHEARVAKLRRRVEKIEAEEERQAQRSFFQRVG